MAKAKAGLMEVFKEALRATVRLCLLTQDRPAEPQASHSLFKCLHKPYYWPRAPGLFLKGSLPNIERHTRPRFRTLCCLEPRKGTASLQHPSITVQGGSAAHLSIFFSEKKKKKNPFSFFGLVMPKCNQVLFSSSLPTV